MDPIVVNFNIAMDPANVAANFTLKDPSGNPVSGKTSWNDSHTSLTFKPDTLLAGATTYTLSLSRQAQAFGGAPLGNDFSTTFKTYPNFAVASTTPASGGALDSNGGIGFGVVTVAFSAPLQPGSLTQYFTLSPTIGNYGSYADPDTNQSYILSGYFLPSTTYTLTVSADLADAWGEKLGKSYTFSFNSQPATPALAITALQNGSPVVFLTTADTGLAAQATNLKNVTITRSTLTLKDLTALLGHRTGTTCSKPTNRSTRFHGPVSLSLTPDRSQVTSISVSNDGRSLPAGLYFLSLASNELVNNGQTIPGPLLLVVSPSHLTFKMTPTRLSFGRSTWQITLPSLGQPSLSTIRMTT